MPGSFEKALASIGAAITDVREKVVEEGYFGRVVTDGPSAPESVSAASPAVPDKEENSQIASWFNQKFDTVISAPPDLDARPHGQSIDPEPGGGMDL